MSVAFDAPKSCARVLERFPKHVVYQTRHILEDDSSRSVGAQVLDDMIKDGATALGIVRSLAQSRPGKRLARKARSVEVTGRCCLGVTERDVVEEVFRWVVLLNEAFAPRITLAAKF